MYEEYLDDPLISAVNNGDVIAVKTLIGLKANIDKCDHYQKTLLMHAIECHMSNVAICLIKEGANINKIDYNGDTALIIASRVGNKKMIKYLLDVGVDRNVVNYYYETAILSIGSSPGSNASKNINEFNNRRCLGSPGLNGQIGFTYYYYSPEIMKIINPYVNHKIYPRKFPSDDYFYTFKKNSSLKDDIKSILENKVWTPQYHYRLRNKRVRQIIRTMMIIRSIDGNITNILPSELMYCIFTFVL